ncbi:iron-containing alcohol dehydrogenase [Peribacillus huizhouensis]|uniref:Alcohol dehydrogenase class IV n=1 Tax=Peribacillus huizhouensis TaxID=1501239 RepID=A0ABR6CQP8_9BACI|nr:iron-containing alcohol dehydrogenase [Peribacillus huizhouensis]MBA9027361.1 alcohol dehydrogenase class IV [Peribacillus huizhouensis]
MAVLDLPRNILIENGAINHLAKIVASKGGRKIFILMDSFLAKSPINLHQKVKQILMNSGLESKVFTEFSGEPTTKNVADALFQLNAFQGDCVIGIGGGSAIDLAKALSVFGENKDMEWDTITQYQKLDRLPLFAVPTTSGTGSEVTKVMVITNLDTNIKMNPSHPNLVPDVAILDPELTLSLPPSFTVYTGLDALSHAIEGFLSNKASIMTNLFSLEAIKKIGNALPKVYENGADIESRRDMILASCYAGIAFSNASTNLAHATGRALGARFHIPHGLSVALLMPFVMRFSLDSCRDQLAEIAMALGANPSLGENDKALYVIRTLEDFNEQFGIWRDGLKYMDSQQLIVEIPTLVTDSLSGNGIATNRKVPTEHDIQVIYYLLAEKLSKMDSQTEPEIINK